MIILDKPYVSDFLIETIKNNNFSVLDNEIARKYFKENELTSIDKINQNELFYANSENSINLIFENMPNSKLAEMVDICKQKSLFRSKLKTVYPNYFFESFMFEELFKINPDNIPYPVILKPDVGFLSFGVYTIKNKNEWQNTITNLKEDIKKFSDVFPKEVVNTSKFIVEKMIEGDEYALDAYFDKNGEAVILNIFEHPFFNDKDVSDRAYFTSKEIIQKNLEKFKKVLDKIGKTLDFKNFPFHLELRANEENIIPIEINPLRFCGWCITDIAQNAWGINVYEYFLNNKKPDWKEILKNSDDNYYYFTIGDIPSDTVKGNIKIDFEKYLKNISNPLVIRKIDPNKNPVFAIVFAKTDNLDEIKNILKLDMKEFIL